MNTNDTVTGPPDNQGSLNELFGDVLALVDHEIEGITEEQIEERLHQVLDANGYDSDSSPRSTSAEDDRRIDCVLPEFKLTEILLFDWSMSASEWRSVCRQMHTARREAAEILAAAQQDAESSTAAARIDAQRITREADEYADAAVLRAAQIVADAWEEADRIVAEAKGAAAAYLRSASKITQAHQQISIPAKRSGDRIHVTYISGNVREIPTRSLSYGMSCALDTSSPKRNVDGGNGLAEKRPTATCASVGVSGGTERVVRVGAVDLDALTEVDVVQAVRRGWREGRGGSIVTSNVNVAQLAAQDREVARLVDEATLTVADGMPLVWASRLQGKPLPERITKFSLVFSLSQAAAEDRRSVFLLGGAPGTPEAAARRLQERYPALQIVGTDSPPYGFERSEAEVARIVDAIAAASPHLVLVGLGFPKQERLIERLREVIPDAWYLGCGTGIAMAAGQCRRAPAVLQQLGMEWAYRLILEPRRLTRRYLRHNLPFALGLLAGATASRRPVGGAF